MDDKLREKLNRLGVVKGFRSLAEVSQADPRPRAEAERREVALPGAACETDHGVLWLDRRIYGGDHAHGSYALGDLATLSDAGLALLGAAELGERPAFLDTETTGLAGGAGTLAFLIGIGLWDGERFTLNLVFMRDPGEEAAALHYVDALLDQATGLVTFNGRGFDVPLLQSRFIVNRLAPHWLGLPHLDLLGVARALWRDHLPSRSLGSLEQAVLAVQRSDEDLPSSLIPDLYRQYLESGNAAEMARIFYHNEVDVLSMASLLIHTEHLITRPASLSPAAAEWVGIGRLLDRAGRQEEAVAAWRQALSGVWGELEPACANRVWQELAERARREGRWEGALESWAAWAEAIPDAVEPLVALAKHEEWVRRDFEIALAYTERALLRAHRLPRGMLRYRVLAEVQHRRERLLRRLERPEGAVPEEEEGEQMG